jgi:hypothetical protein
MFDWRDANRTKTTIPSTSSTSDVIWGDTETISVKTEDDDNEDNVGNIQKAFGSKYFGEGTDTYPPPCLYNRRFLDKQYGIRREDGMFMISNSNLSVDDASDITIKEKRFKGTRGLWELLTPKNFNTDANTT